VLGKQNCSLAYSSFALMPFLGNQLPDANDLITILEGNTKVALAASTAAVVQTMESTPCIDAYTQQADNVAATRIVAKLHATGMPQSVFPRSSTQEVSALPKLLAIPTVYHKLALTCLATTQTTSGVCLDEFGSLLTSGQGTLLLQKLTQIRSLTSPQAPAWQSARDSRARTLLAPSLPTSRCWESSHPCVGMLLSC